LRDETVLSTNTHSNGFYFIMQGSVCLYHNAHPDIKMRTLEVGAMFGDDCLLNEPAAFDFV
jgi:CRP-like cAMP-binding protein